MKNNNNNIEVLLFSKYSLTDSREKELVNWLTTTLQSAIGKPYEKAKKLFAIYAGSGLMRQYPALYNIVPKHLVAAYLGVSRETLSRLYHSS